MLPISVRFTPYQMDLFVRHFRGILKVLTLIQEFREKFRRDPYTREFLSIIRAWGYGHKLLKLCEELGLIVRYEGYLEYGKYRVKCIFNTLTKLGEQILTMFAVDTGDFTSDDGDMSEEEDDG